CRFRSICTCCDTAAAMLWRMRATTHGRYRPGSATRTFSTPYATPSCHPIGSRTFGADRAAFEPSIMNGRQDDGLAGRLRVEGPVGFLGLLEPPAVREEPLHVHLPVGDEFGALGLALPRERPRPHQRYLPAQEIRADVERDVASLA